MSGKEQGQVNQPLHDSVAGAVRKLRRRTGEQGQMNWAMSRMEGLTDLPGEGAGNAKPGREERVAGSRTSVIFTGMAGDPGGGKRGG